MKSLPVKIFHTLGSTGAYSLGTVKGIITPMIARMTILAHSKPPSMISSGSSVNVAKGHMSRYMYVVNSESRTMLRWLEKSRPQREEANMLTSARNNVYTCNVLLVNKS